MSTARYAGILMLVLAPISAALAEGERFDLDKIVGVYRHPLKVETVDDGIVPMENILEIVRYGETSAYMRTRLHFTNGHLCGLFGIAEVEGDQLVYRSASERDTSSQCILALTIGSGTIVFEDKAECQLHCGFRGGFTSAEFKRSHRRPIAYLDRIRKSRQYQEAVEEYERLLQSRAKMSVKQKQP
jgi:hypothetical protein